MARERQKLKVILMMNGERIETLTQAQREEVARRFSEVFSRYYANHPDEYRILCEHMEAEEAAARA